MSFRHKTYGGIVRYDHEEKVIFVQRRLNPLQLHAKLVEKMREEYPEYKVITESWVLWLLRLHKSLLWSLCYSVCVIVTILIESNV